MGLDDPRRDELLSELLAEYDEQLANGVVGPHVDASCLFGDAELMTAWNEDRHSLELLHRVKRNWTPDPADLDTLTRPEASIATPRAAALSALGRFRVQHELGSGGLGVVYLAYDPKLRRQVALKVPRLESLSRNEFRDRFLREAEAAARLSHPHIVHVYETGEAGLVCFIASEYCHGPTLADWLKSRCSPVPIRTAAQLVRQLAAAVQHAHGRGVLHRDIKPSNVLLVKAGDHRAGFDTGVLTEPDRQQDGLFQIDADDVRGICAKLTDFGMAKLLDSEGDVTRSGSLIGTPAYMAPEQAQGRVEDIDARADVYALGAVLYELLTGQRLFGCASEIETLRRILYEEPTAPRNLRTEVPRDLEAICLRCISKRAESRYTTAQELADDLDRFLDGEPTEARPLPTIGKLAKWVKRKPAIAGLAGVASILLVALLGVVVWDAERLRQEVVRADSARDAARQEAAASRRLLYAADMQMGFEAWRTGDYTSVRQRVDRYEPAAGEEDLRTFAWHSLSNQCYADQQELYRHDSKVRSVAYSTDGTLVASGGYDGKVNVWDVNASGELVELVGHADEVNDLAFSPDGRHLASAGQDHTLRIWNLKPGEPPHVLEGFSHLPIHSIGYSPDGSRLASSGEDGIIRLWDTEKWKVVSEWSDHGTSVEAIAFSADGTRLLSGGRDAIARVRCLATGRVLTECEISDKEMGMINAVAFSHDGNKVATASWMDRRIRIWDAQTGKLLDRIYSVDGYRHNIAFSPDDRLLACGLRNGLVRIWDVPFSRQAYTLTGHEADVQDLAFSPDGTRLVTASADKTVKQWNMESIARRQREYPTATPVAAVVFSPRGSTCAIMENGGDVTLIDAHVGEPTLRIVAEAGTFVPAPVFSPDGKLLAYADDAGQSVCVCEIESRKHLARFIMPNGRVNAIAFSTDGFDVLTASDQSQLVRWNIATGQAAAMCEMGQKEPFAVVPLRRSDAVVTAGYYDVVVRDGRTLAQRWTLPAASQKIGALAVSPDERLLVGATVTGSLPIWNLADRQIQGTLVGLPVKARSVPCHLTEARCPLVVEVT
ncbi:MAG: serine/threonine-protein kinase [Pirellulales bacterium]